MANKEAKQKYIAKTLFGLEDVLEGELKALGAGNIVKTRRAVSFEGNKGMLYKANYCLRSALSVLKPVHTLKIRVARDLYKGSVNFPWEDIMDINQTFSIKAVVHSDIFSHTGYPALILKDAIADRFRKKFKERPSVDSVDPDISINCHISERWVTISLDSSQIPLFKRGYRTVQTKAPINEVLAAGIVLKSGWDSETPLLDPMCGSGTIGIEAAMIASKIPPGRYRTHYGFMNWNDYDHKLYSKVLEEANSESIQCPVKIFSRDISANNLRIARINISNAGLEDSIRSSVADFLDSDSAGKKYVIIINPPYGERLEEEGIDDLYSGIGERLKHGYEGSSAWIISSNLDAIKYIGLKPSVKHTLYNGKLETRLLKYDMYSGSNKKKKV